ncbi:MAG TPA: carboxypeptidase-like regulatory domain-containing protein [Planctomycetota bacterium]|nr:carboxypeptidase-like regulatory domain-containing protein [Planctomycetota bacterium]
MQRSSATFLLAAAILVGVAAIAWLNAGDGLPPPEEGPGQDSGPGSGLGTATTAPRVGSPSALPPDTLRVVVEVQVRERYVPPPPRRAQAVRASDGAELPTQLVAGVGAGFDAPSRTAGIAAAVIDFEGVRLVRQVPVGEAVSRTVVGARVATRGRIQDAAQKPIAGARVWLGEQDAEGTEREVLTDAEGAFELDTPSGEGVPFVVRARGYAAAWRPVAVVPAGIDLQMILQPGSVLEVQLAALGTDLGQARLFVVPTTTVTSELAQFPFFLQALTDGAAVDDNGRGQVVDLPANGKVGILVRHPMAAAGAPHEVMLASKLTSAIVPLKFAETRWSGQVVDPEGRPLGGVSVWSLPARANLAAVGSVRLLPPHLEVLGACASHTDEQGAFAVGGLPGAGSVLSLRAHGCAGRDVVWADVGPGSRFVMAPWLGGEPALRVLPPAAGAVWVAEADLAGGIRATLEKDEPWQVSLPHAGRFDVKLTVFAGTTQRAAKTLHDVHATGVVELQAPRPE